MARLLVSDIVEAVQAELSQVTGTATNIYGTPRMIKHIEDAYITLIDEFGDRTLKKVYDVALDGTTGVIDADLVPTQDNHEINRFEDILFVWPDGTDRQLAVLPPNMNPAIVTDGEARYIEANDTTNRPFMCYPITATGDFQVMARAYPVLPLTEESYIYIDRMLITYYAAYLYAEDDATAVGAIGKFKGLAEQRQMQLKNASSNQRVRLDPRSANATNEWWTN